MSVAPIGQQTSSKFKVGDKVVCTETLKWNGYSVTKGKIYVVLDCNLSSSTGIQVASDCGKQHSWFKWERFDLTTDAIPTCECLRNSYKDPGIEHFYFCHNYVEGDKQ